MRTFLHTHKLSFYFIFFVCCFFILSAGITFAVDPDSRATEQYAAPGGYTPIVDIPGLNGNTLSTEGYIQALYYLSITVAALLVVFKILVAGIKYMFDGVVTHKEEAKKDIRGALLGLLIVLSAVLILETINGNLTNLNILGNAPPLDTINRPATPVNSACEISPNSKACCDEQGGTIVQNGNGGRSSGTRTCVKPQTTPIPDDITDSTNRYMWCSMIGGRYNDAIKECQANDDPSGDGKYEIFDTNQTEPEFVESECRIVSGLYIQEENICVI